MNTSLNTYFRPLTLVLLLLAVFETRASKLEKGFEALQQRDYFRAKKLLSDVNHSAYDTYASYGLATIFSRSDNPFFNADSAAKYVRVSYNLFVAAPKILKLSGFLVDGPGILQLADSITALQLSRLKKELSLAGCNQFLLENPLAAKKIKEEVVYWRDELEFNQVLLTNRSDSTLAFLLAHPLSGFYTEASLLYDRQLFDENTLRFTETEYISFLKKYPHNAMVNTAYESLFQIYKQRSDANGLKNYVKDYPQAPQNLDAWKLLFSLSVKSFSNDELTRFLEEYPDFPLKNSILKELELNKITLYPYQEHDLVGFINTEGKRAIMPDYDAATGFYEGLAVVNKNDSVFFINKENENPFHKTYAEAFPFRHGIAPVKQGSKWFFINRQGQVISKAYDEISEMSDFAYVVKQGGKYGAVDNYGKPLIEPRFYKLGDFKNGLAYYMEDGKYGFVSRLGSQHKAEFEWISDFDAGGIAVFRHDNKYGLVRSNGKKILEAQFDQVFKAHADVFVVVLGGNYGFYSARGCFLSLVSYDFAKDKTAEYYSDGTLLRLVRKGEQSLIDENGKTLVPFGAYTELGFFAEGLLRVKKTTKKESRYGFLDKRFSLAIACKYEEAADFADSLALVTIKGRTALIDYSGNEVFVTEHPVEKVAPHYYLVNGNLTQLVDSRGTIVFTSVAGVQKAKEGVWIVTMNSGEIKLLYDETF